ncbi:MAG: rod shape-determining protein MreC [Candidatus Magasanikbacteria bacterium]
MKTYKNYINLLILVATLLLFFLFPNVFYKSFNYIKFTFNSFLDRGFNYQKLKELKKENKKLKFELKQVKKFGASPSDNEYQKARVFSKYPFSNKKNITIDLGSKEGIKKGMPVLTKSKYLLGKVISVRERIANVKTIFSKNWKNSVGLGSPKTEAVLSGGTPPEIKLIPRDVKFPGNPKVFNLSSDYPLYQLMGKAENIQKSEESVLRKAYLKTPYSFSNIIEVFVITNFP